MGMSIVEDHRASFTSGSIEAQIGNTPLLRLDHFERDLPNDVQLFAKAEHLNPGGSVKDRAALSMIVEGERTGKLRRGMTIVDATSGNTGIAYAMIGAARGYRVTVCLPSNASVQRKEILRAYGVEIIETDPLLLTDGAQQIARNLYQSAPAQYFYPNQYNNDANWLAHYEGTANEIWQQTEGAITHFVTGVGTSGTFVGVVRRLKVLAPNVRAVLMQPDLPLHGLEGVKHLASASQPGIYDPALADDIVEVSTDNAYITTRRLAREAGIFVGPSSGANVFAACELARKLTGPVRIVTVLCDGGERYTRERIFA